MNLQDQILTLGRQAKVAARELGKLSPDQKNRILLAMAEELVAQTPAILAANALDIAAASEPSRGLSKAMIDRLRLDEKRVAQMADGVRQVAALPDPVGEVLRDWTVEKNGLRIVKKRVPIGVIGIIYESRPNVTSDAAVLCLKAGNATILRGGSEAFHSNMAIAQALAAGSARAGGPVHAIQLVPVTDRESVKLLAQMDGYLDLIIPRGGKGLIEAVVSAARVPVIKHYDGICHVYIDKEADLRMGRDIIVNAKMQKPGVCNAAETLLLHREIAGAFLEGAGRELLSLGVELHGDEFVVGLLGDAVKPASEADYRTEWLDLILSVRVVPDLAAAIGHINEYGSHHSDAIVTRDDAAAERFLSEVDSATVYVNASTRFTDGEEFGFGAEIGISTDKLHARGPMGLEELTSYKYLLRGDGQVR